MLILKNFSITELLPLSLKVKQGECIGLSGESGCGKTRLLRAIADLDEHEGELQLDDLSWDTVPAHKWRTQVALLPAESQWWFDTVGEHFSEKSGVLPALGFNLDVLLWDSVRCSSGEKQRLSILRLLANKPRVLLLDEPTANLDESNGIRVERLIAEYIVNNNAIAIWVSHDPAQLRRVSNRQFYIENGSLHCLHSDIDDALIKPELNQSEDDSVNG